MAPYPYRNKFWEWRGGGQILDDTYKTQTGKYDNFKKYALSNVE